MALTVRKCEHFGPVKHWNLILWYLKHFLSYCDGSKKCPYASAIPLSENFVTKQEHSELVILVVGWKWMILCLVYFLPPITSLQQFPSSQTTVSLWVVILVIRKCSYMWFDHKNFECADSGVWKCVRRGAAKRARASVVQLPARNAIMALRHFWPRKILLTQTHAFLLKQEGKYYWSREGLSDLCDYWKFINLSSHMFWLETNSVPKSK